MNNKGQTLVIFILILPLLLALIGLVIDIGILSTEKRKVDHSMIDAVEYGMKHIEDENVQIKIKSLIQKNISNVEKIDLIIENESITLTIIKHKPSLFQGVIPRLNYEIKSTYKGYLSNEQIKIVKE